MSSVHAVIVSYWPKRRPNVQRIVKDLLAGTVVPERITILDNNPHVFPLPNGVDGDERPWTSNFPHSPIVDVVASTANTWTRGKFVTALLHPAPYSLLMDDDTSVGTRTVERLLNWSAGRRGLVTGYWGVKLSPDNRFIAGAGIIQPNLLGDMHFTNHAIAEVPVDGFHGRAMWMSYDAIVRMLAVEEFVRFDDEGNQRYAHEGDDILAGLANPPRWAEGDDTKGELPTTGSYVIPLREDEQFVDLDQCEEALQFQEGYFDERDRFCQEAVAIIRERGIPRW
jgi:hypothetical protein